MIRESVERAMVKWVFLHPCNCKVRWRQGLVRVAPGGKRAGVLYGVGECGIGAWGGRRNALEVHLWRCDTEWSDDVMVAKAVECPRPERDGGL